MVPRLTSLRFIDINNADLVYDLLTDVIPYITSLEIRPLRPACKFIGA